MTGRLQCVCFVSHLYLYTVHHILSVFMIIKEFLTFEKILDMLDGFCGGMRMTSVLSASKSIAWLLHLFSQGENWRPCREQTPFNWCSLHWKKCPPYVNYWFIYFNVGKLGFSGRFKGMPLFYLSFVLSICLYQYFLQAIPHKRKSRRMSAKDALKIDNFLQCACIDWDKNSCKRFKMSCRSTANRLHAPCRFCSGVEIKWKNILFN